MDCGMMGALAQFCVERDAKCSMLKSAMYIGDSAVLQGNADIISLIRLHLTWFLSDTLSKLCAK